MFILHNIPDRELYQSRLEYVRDFYHRMTVRYGEKTAEEYADELWIGMVAGPIQMLEELLGLEVTPMDQLKKREMGELLQIEGYLKSKLANRSPS
ncbi:MAG: hypothetical protein ACKV2Q_01385 [Planctomycetaceae bacterium]